MKKKSLFTLLVTVLIAVIAIGCNNKGGNYKFDPYDDFTGIDETAVLQIDDYVTLDGELTEDIWTESKNAVVVEGATVMQGSGNPIDVEEWGEREMTVYTYIGEKAIYFAFEVTDRNLYYNSSRAQGGNSTVEVYFTSTEHTKFERGCFSLRVSVTGFEENNGTLVNTYVPTALNDEWKISKTRGKTAAAAKVDGTVCNYDTTNFDTSNNVGYVIEAAIAWDLIADEKPAGIQYTAAFCQAAGYNRNRLNNTFIPGTNYMRPATWKLITNDGIVEDKNAFLDQSVKVEEGVTLDGKLDEALWEGAQPRTYVSGHKRADNGKDIYLSTYNVNTDEGVYVGFESNEDMVYGGHSDPRFNTGVELLLAVGGTTTINKENVIQYRYNVDGTNVANTRWVGNQSDYPYTQAYFPAKQGGYVIGADGNEGEMNISDAQGWSGEIFIPWSAFNVSTAGYRDGVALIPNYYRRTSGTDEATAQRAWVRPVEVNICSNGSQNINPQEKWFLFENGKPLYDSVGVNDVSFEKADLVTDIDGNYYEANIFAGYTDNVATVLQELFPGLENGTFGFEPSLGVTVTESGDGYYTIRVPESAADTFGVDGKDVTFTSGELTDTFNFSIDNEFALDGILSEPTYANLKKLSYTMTNVSTVHTEFTVALRKNAMYLYVLTDDANYSNNYNSVALGMELYFNFGDTLSSRNTYQIRLLTANNAKDRMLYTYKDVAGSDGWSWDENGVRSEIERVFVDNNNGTYQIEAKIPYSVFGLSEKPEWVEICPAVKFIKSGTSTTTRFFYEGNEKPSRHKNLYMRFTEAGFTPDVFMFDNANKAIEQISVIKGVGLSEGNYVGTIKLSHINDGNVPVVDAVFSGDFENYFTSYNNGTYAFAIPASLFDGANSLTASWTSSITSGNIVIKATDLSSVYFIGSNALGSSNTLVNAYPHTVVEHEGSKYYKLDISVFGDENCSISVPSDLYELEFTIAGVDGVITNVVADNLYEVLIPVDEITENTTYVISGSTIDGSQGTIQFVPKALSAEKQNYLVDNMLVYMNMNGNVDDLTHAHETEMIYGSASYGDDAYYNMAQASRSLNVKGLDLSGKSFTISMMVNGDELKNTYTQGYASVLFGNNTVDRQIKNVGDTMLLRYRGYNKNGESVSEAAMFGIGLYDETGKDLGAVNLIDVMNYLEGWNRLTFTFDFGTPGSLIVKVYVDGTLRVSAVKTGLIDFKLDATTWGIGGPAQQFDFNAGNADVPPYKNINVTVGLDDFMIIEGILDDESILAIDGYTEKTVSKIGFAPEDVFFEQGSLVGGEYATEFNIASLIGIPLEGATLVDAPDGITLTDGRLSFTAEAISAINGTITLTLQIGDVQKEFNVTYVPYTTLYAENATVYEADAIEGEIELTVKISADEDMLSSVAGASLTASTLTGSTVTDNGDGTYTIKADASAFASAATHTVTVTLGAAQTQFTISYKTMDALNASVFLDFNEGDYANRITGAASEATGTIATVEGTDGTDAAILKTGDASQGAHVNISNAALGSDDFTIAFTTKLFKAQTKGGSGAAGYEILNSGSSVDSGADTVQLSIMQTAANSGKYQFRIQLGKNIAHQRFVVDLSAQQAEEWLDNWIDVVLIVDRDCDYEQTPGVTSDITFTETAYAYLYINGELVHTNRLFYGTDQVLGNGTIRLAGNKNWHPEKDVYMDNFAVFNRVLNAREIGLLDAYADYWNAQSQWSVGAASFDFSAAAGKDPYVHTLDIISTGTDISTAEITGIPQASTATVQYTTGGVGLYQFRQKS